jgi:hypothetical protein
MELTKILFGVLAIFLNASNTYLPDNMVETKCLYKECHLKGHLEYDVFEKAMIGFEKINGKQKTGLITIIDFTKQSTTERLFIIDLNNKKLIKKSLVSHGKNSGENYAESFSNTPGSLKSCLGFFLTADTYYGKHGYSLRLTGLEKGFNDNAHSRSIVIHGASYVSQSFVKEYGRIGRSFGCPAVPIEDSKSIIDLIKEESVLFIYGVDKEYFKESKYLN